MKTKTPGTIVENWWVGAEGTCRMCRGTIELDESDGRMLNQRIKGRPTATDSVLAKCPTDGCVEYLAFYLLHLPNFPGPNSFVVDPQRGDR